MTKEGLSKLTDDELRVQAKKLKSSSIWSAFAIGLMIGIIVYSVLVNSYGFFTLIPLYFIYKMVKGAKNKDALKAILKDRGIK